MADHHRRHAAAVYRMMPWRRAGYRLTNLIAAAGAASAALIVAAGIALLWFPGMAGIALAASLAGLAAAILGGAVWTLLLRPLRMMVAFAERPPAAGGPAAGFGLPADFAAIHAALQRCETDREAALARVAMHRVIAENTSDLIVCGDGANNRIYVSPSYREMLGYDPEELLGGHAFSLVHPGDLTRVAAVFAAIGPACPSTDLVFRMRRKDDHYLWMEARYRYLPETGGIVAVLRNITARKEAQDRLVEMHARLEAANQQLAALARQDVLTGLGNRRYFDEILDRELRRARRLELPLGLVLIDVDCFKAYNDRYGHIAGDRCLRRISEAIAGTLRRPGDEAARYGGEEIVVLLPATDEAGALAMANRFLAAVRELGIEHLGSEHGIATISAGASAIMPYAPDHDPNSLVEAADLSLYEAKEGGRDRAVSKAITINAARERAAG